MKSPKSSLVSEFLKYPSPIHQCTTFQPKSCGRVLTSTENLSALEKREYCILERKRAREEKRSVKKTRARKNIYACFAYKQ